MASTTVDTRHGAVRGAVAGGVIAFKGIPYAAPPVGPNRFLPPQPVVPWTGVRDATRFGPTAPKAPYAPPLDALIHEVDVPGEDYLNLNVWTPDLSGRLPVMVWIHGGAFVNGSGSAYDGSAFARDGVVCVTLNYRLGTDGFLYFEDTANRGLLDQVAALQWVQDNIEAFGGDPGQITVFGESAGGMSIGMLLGMPKATGLFHRAILQSGGSQHAVGPATAEKLKLALAGKLGVAPTKEGFSAVPTEQLVVAQQQLRGAVAMQPDPGLWGEAALTMLPFAPVIDGDTIPGPPNEHLAEGVDILVGSNSDEFRLYVVPNGAFDYIGEERLNAAFRQFGLDPVEGRAVYQASRPGAAANELFCAVFTDWHFRIPAIRIAERARTAYMYEFAWQAPTFDGKLGACHAADIPFVFDNLDDNLFENLLGPHLPQHLADTMHSAWVSFATHGNPGWFPYETGNRSTMRFDIESEVVVHPQAEELALWEGVR
ncbi:para-nitrobenzyl esterase [Kibdelosporangium banguiense]|uniref:Carboxylic ester hydrolase n=1 Tax=Kibdelosporangium banguiense TaxID=1365924 RepID=A0ABS4T8X6_9PSEU|nr:carboxylesterase/lipase family protein [Kibdelosporangium banguiense]MBP2320288.1 para-nitrobenzyl esterase [Kibdelosporangium banguiense]